MRRAVLVLAVGAVLLVLALRARRERPARPAEAPRRPAPATVVEDSEVTKLPGRFVTSTPPAEVEVTKLPGSFVTPPPPPPVVEAPAGSVWGVVTLMGERPRRKRVKMDSDPACAALHAESVLSDDFVVDAENRVRWAVIYVKKGLGERRFEPPTVPARLEAVGCRYAPHVLFARVDQPVEFVNRDAFMHCVHGLPFQNRGFNFGLPPKETVEKRFGGPEIFKVTSDIHPWMSAWIAVVDHPFVAITGEDGRFRIPGLPPGRYEIEAWHEGLKSETREADVGDVDVRLDFLLQRR